MSDKGEETKVGQTDKLHFTMTLHRRVRSMPCRDGDTGHGGGLANYECAADTTERPL